MESIAADQVKSKLVEAALKQLADDLLSVNITVAALINDARGVTLSLGEASIDGSKLFSDFEYSGVGAGLVSVIVDEVSGGHPWYGILGRAGLNAAAGTGGYALGSWVAVSVLGCPETGGFGCAAAVGFLVGGTVGYFAKYPIDWFSKKIGW